MMSPMSDKAREAIEDFRETCIAESVRLSFDQGLDGAESRARINAAEEKLASILSALAQETREAGAMVLAAFNETGEQRTFLRIEDDDCQFVAEILQEWHETDPNRKLRIVPALSSVPVRMGEMGCSPSASPHRESGVSGQQHAAIVGTIYSLNFDLPDATLVTFRVPVESAWGVGQYLISRNPSPPADETPSENTAKSEADVTPNLPSRMIEER